MHFTREPIIETIITPKEGYKLIVRNTKSVSQESEFLVDAIEVVSFGHSFFYRCLEKPKPFLVPITDFEVIEVKETRLALKNVSIERSIKIGSGRAPKEQPIPEVIEESLLSEESQPSEARAEKKRERHRRRRRHRDEEPSSAAQQQESSSPESSEPGKAKEAPAIAPATPTLSRLIPPPPTLIAQTIGRYKEQQSGSKEAEAKHEESAQEPSADHSEKKKDDSSDSESRIINRITSFFS